MASIYYFYTFLKNDEIKDYKISLVLMGLSVLSSFVIIYVFIGLILVYNIFQYLKQGKSIFKLKTILKINTPSFFAMGIILLILFEPIRKLTEAKQLYFGGETSFIHDSIGFLIGSLLHYGNYSNSIKSYVFYSFFLLLTIAIFIVVKDFFKKKLSYSLSLLIVPLVFLLSVFLITTFNHYFLGSKYIIQRTALFLFPITMLCLIAVLNYFYKTSKGKMGAVLLSFLISFIFIQHTIKCVNTYSYFDWHYDINSKKIMEALAQEHITNKQATLGAHPFFAPTANYYKTKYKLDWLAPVSRAGIDTTKHYDYIFGQLKDIERFKDYQHKIIIGFKNNNNYLVSGQK